ncbi:hypothetical protein [Sulfurovum sp.]|uniref:hypothetical protein n=1 Tax=Sulfurovum sp. TaxID=1969726 RepID=UPI0035657A50
MFEIDPKKTRQFVLTGTDDVQLKQEIEKLFCALDSDDSPRGMYSPEGLRKKYPFLVQFFQDL